MDTGVEIVVIIRNVRMASEEVVIHQSFLL